MTSQYFRRERGRCQITDINVAFGFMLLFCSQHQLNKSKFRCIFLVISIFIMNHDHNFLNRIHSTKLTARVNAVCAVFRLDSMLIRNHLIYGWWALILPRISFSVIQTQPWIHCTTASIFYFPSQTQKLPIIILHTPSALLTNEWLLVLYLCAMQLHEVELWTAWSFVIKIQPKTKKLEITMSVLMRIHLRFVLCMNCAQMSMNK